MTVLKADEFVTEVAEAFGTSKKEAKEIIQTFTGVIEEVVFSQQKGVRLGGIGTLRPEIVPEREHNNPQTGGKIVKPEHYAMKFRVNSAFKRDLEKLDVQ